MSQSAPESVVMIPWQAWAFLATHTGALLWWASRITTKVSQHDDQLKEGKKEIKALDAEVRELQLHLRRRASDRHDP